MKVRTRKFLYITSALISPVMAQNVGWGTGSSFDEDRYMSYTSSGAADTGQITWDLGYFANAFVPTQTNWTDWAANWVAVDTTTNGIQGTNQWGVTSNFSVLGEIQDDVAGSFAVRGGSATGISSGDFITAAGETIWVFAYNDLSMLGSEDGEALLYSYNEIYPSDVETTQNDIATTNGYDIDVVWGQIDREYAAEGGVLWGGDDYVFADGDYDYNYDGIADSVMGPDGEYYVPGGYFSNRLEDSQPTGTAAFTAADGTFEAQLGTWAIPEPSSSLLFGLGGVTLLLRRRRA